MNLRDFDWAVNFVKVVVFEKDFRPVNMIRGANKTFDLDFIDLQDDLNVVDTYLEDLFEIHQDIMKV